MNCGDRARDYVAKALREIEVMRKNSYDVKPWEEFKLLAGKIASTLQGKLMVEDAMLAQTITQAYFQHSDRLVSWIKRKDAEWVQEGDHYGVRAIFLDDNGNVNVEWAQGGGLGNGLMSGEGEWERMYLPPGVHPDQLGDCTLLCFHALIGKEMR